jgi:hypothetical protein
VRLPSTVEYKQEEEIRQNDAGKHAFGDDEPRLREDVGKRNLPAYVSFAGL